MADMNMPSITDLSQLQFLPPGLNMMAGQGVQNALASQQTGLQQQGADLQRTNLQNLFDESNNPTRLAQGQANLAGTTSENILKKIDADQRQTLAPEELAAKRQKMVTGLADDQLKEFMSHAEQNMMSEDPAIAEKAKDAYLRSAKEVSRRETAKDTQANTSLIVSGRENVAGVNADAKVDAAKLLADAKIAAKTGTAQDFDTLILKNAKSPAAQAEIRISRAEKLLSDGDTEGAARQYALAEQARQRVAEDSKNKGLAYGIDTPAVADLPAKPSPTATAPVRVPGGVQAPPGPANTLPPLAGRPVITPGYQQQMNQGQAQTLQQEYLKAAPGSVDEAAIAKELQNIKAPIPQRPTAGAADLPKFAGPSDPGFAQLPSGAKFIGPNGKEYTKH